MRIININKIRNFLRKTKQYLCDFFLHLFSFWFSWIALAAMLFVSFMDVPNKMLILTILVFIFLAVLIFKPMNIIYGLIGTHGYIGFFFLLFFVVNVVFAGIYYQIFFQNAGVTYDINQPHVEFNLFEFDTVSERIVYRSEGIETLPVTNNDTAHYYYRIDFSWVMRNTLLTSLMQEPTDFYSVSSTYTGVSRNKEDLNYDIAKFFQWFLVFHILVSWILLGVFISLVYQKFRKI